MTREEMFDGLYEIKNWKCNGDSKMHEVISEAIKVLEQEPCEDCISRAEAIEINEKYHGQMPNDINYQIWQELNELPSIQPKPKTEHWILADEQNKEDVENDNYRFICSECQCSDIHAKGTIVPYCWNCGAKMIEPQNLKYADNDTMMPAT